MVSFRLRSVFGLLALLGPAMGAAQPPREISIVDYGAVPNGSGDAGPALRAAVAACRRVEHPCLVLPRGTYRLRAEGVTGEAFAEFERLPEITVRGDRAELVGNGLKTVFLFKECGRVDVSGVDVDWDPLPYTVGRVVATAADSIDLAIVRPQVARPEVVQSLLSFDGERRLPLRSGDPGYFLLTQKAFPKRAAVLGPDRLRVYLSPKPEILRRTDSGQQRPAVGSYLLAWYQMRGATAFRPIGCGDVRIEDCRVFAVPGMGFANNGCESVSLRKCAVMIKPGSGRWLSSTVDASHCNMIRRRVELIDCVFEHCGDDAANVHGMYTQVQERLDARTVILRGWKSIFNQPIITDDLAAPGMYSLRLGDLLEFGRRENPLVPTFDGAIVAVSVAPVRGYALKRVRLDRDLPDYVQAGSIVGDAAETPSLLMQNCRIEGNRGCGVRVKTRHALVTGCTFTDVAGAGVWVTCDAAVDQEGPATRDVVIRDNVFRGTSPAISSSAGRKELYPDVHEGLVIEGNRIDSGRGPALEIRSVRGAQIRHNTIRSDAARPIVVDHSSGVEVEDNALSSSPSRS